MKAEDFLGGWSVLKTAGINWKDEEVTISMGEPTV